MVKLSFIDTMPMIKTFIHISLLLFIMSLLSCTGTRPSNLGISHGKLVACPSSPNCVSSDADDDAHKISAIQFTIPAADAWKLSRQAVLNLPRTQIITESANYLHAECSSAVFGFVDDLELHLRPAENIIAVRSASRLGHSDFGVNRKRVEAFRSALSKAGASE